jgi:hypothetical protein
VANRLLNLKERFERFMSGLDGAESIDALMKQSNLPGRQRADYLAFNRDVIIEQKSLEVDLDNKIQPLVVDFFRTRGIVQVETISFASFVQIISESPDTGDLVKRLRQIVTQRIDDILAKADKQTHDTRATFVLPHAVGIVVILNENVQLIEPDYVAVKAFDMLRKRGPTGEIRYPDNQVVISISEAHRIPAKDAEKIPTETIFSEAGNRLLIATQYSEILKERWAQFNGAIYVESPDLARDAVTRDPQILFRTGL